MNVQSGFWSVIQIVVVVCCLSVVGCVSEIGSDFRRPGAETLQVGQTTSDDVKVLYGKPVSDRMINFRGHDLRNLNYLYAARIDSSGGLDAIRSRSLGLFFSGHYLVSYDFSSSFSGDSTDFDASKRFSLVEGRTTKRDVIDVLGEPTGVSVWPMAENKGERVLSYSFVPTRGGRDFQPVYRKTLYITIGSDDVVERIKYFDGAVGGDD